MVSPIGVPPGSRVTRCGTPDRCNRAANLCTCVDLPLPSDPSNVMNGSLAMMSFVKQAHCNTGFPPVPSRGHLAPHEMAGWKPA